MTVLQAILLGIIQGITEFLPVSSSAHLVIFQKLFGLRYHDIAFDLVVHLATLLSVFTIFYSVLLRIAREVISFPMNRRKTNGTRAFVLVFWASVPTALIGFTFKDFFKSLFSNLWAVGIFMCVTGLFLFLTRKIKSTNKNLTSDSYSQGLDTIEDISIFKALLIGLAQGGAIAPGISRSGITISTALFSGIHRETAAMYSFLLAIPAILGASLSELIHIRWTQGTAAVLGAGFIASYLSGLIGLWWILRVVKRGRLEMFSIYMWIVGGAAIYFGLKGL